MKKLTTKEEELMQYLWEIKKGFIKDLLVEYPDPKPHYNTVSSLVRLLETKGFIGHKEYGTTYMYFPLISKEEYRKYFMKHVIKDYFDSSYRNLVAFFIDEKNLSAGEINEIIKNIKDKKE